MDEEQKVEEEEMPQSFLQMLDASFPEGMTLEPKHKRPDVPWSERREPDTVSCNVFTKRWQETKRKRKQRRKRSKQSRRKNRK